MARAAPPRRVMLPLVAGVARPRLPAGSAQRARRMPPPEPDPAFGERPVEGPHARIRSQNRDLSERAVDDARRLAQLEDVNTRLETSVQAYQDERSRLESAYRDLRASLPNGSPAAHAPDPGRPGVETGVPRSQSPQQAPTPREDSELRKTEATTDEARGRCTRLLEPVAVGKPRALRHQPRGDP